jgi:predicted O-methyltransferase YrrM
MFTSTAGLLETLALACGASRVLAVGTGEGEVTTSLARMLPADGMMITMEIDAATAGRARERVSAAGQGDRVSVMVGDATRFLHKIAGPFDLIFQDSDEQRYDQMLDRLVDLLRPGGLLVVNRVAGGDVSDALMAFRQRLAADSRLHTSFLAVGDGVSVSVKRAS